MHSEWSNQYLSEPEAWVQRDLGSTFRVFLGEMLRGTDFSMLGLSSRFVPTLILDAGGQPYHSASCACKRHPFRAQAWPGPAHTWLSCQSCTLPTHHCPESCRACVRRFARNLILRCLPIKRKATRALPTHGPFEACCRWRLRC